MRATLKEKVRSNPILAGPARAFLERVQPVRRRDRIDHEHLLLLLSFTLREDANCVDVGCNHGSVLQEMIRRAPAGQHVAFEPVPSLAASLRERFPQVQVYQAALSNEAGTAQFTHVVDADGFSGLSDRNLDGHRLEHFDVDVVRLDDVLPVDYPVDFLKMDVEGAELLALQGAERVLREQRPPIWLEHGEDASAHFGATSNDVWDLLCGEYGYELIDTDGRGPLSRAEFSACLGSMWNFLARPPLHAPANPR